MVLNLNLLSSQKLLHQKKCFAWTCMRCKVLEKALKRSIACLDDPFLPCFGLFLRWEIALIFNQLISVCKLLITYLTTWKGKYRSTFLPKKEEISGGKAFPLEISFFGYGFPFFFFSPFFYIIDLLYGTTVLEELWPPSNEGFFI